MHRHTHGTFVTFMISFVPHINVLTYLLTYGHTQLGFCLTGLCVRSYQLTILDFTFRFIHVTRFSSHDYRTKWPLMSWCAIKQRLIHRRCPSCHPTNRLQHWRKIYSFGFSSLKCSHALVLPRLILWCNDRASSIPRYADFHTALRNSPVAAKFAACRRNTWNCPFLLHLYQIQGFLGSFLILPFIKR